MSVVTERLRLIIEASAKGAANEIRSVEAASGDAAGKTTLLQRAQQKLGVEGASTGTIMKTALAGGIAIGGVALAKFAADGIEQFSSLTSEVRGFQRVAGTSAEESSKLVFATRELGIAPDVASASFGRLETRLGTGKAHLEQYGIATKNAKGETLDASTIVANIAEAYQNADSQSEKAAIGNEAFGKSWQKLAPLLGKGKDDLKALFDEAAKDHQIFSQADLERGRQFALATTQLRDAVTGLKVELGSALVPVVTSATQGLTQGVHAADSATSAIGGLGGAVRIASDNVNVYGAAVQGVNAVGDLFSGHFADAGRNALGAIPGVRGFSNALFGEEEATNKVGDAQKRQQDATTNLANAVAEHGRHSKEARDAQNELVDATRDLDGIQKGLSTTLQTVNDKLQTHTEKLYADQQATLIAGSEKLKLEQSVTAVSAAFDQYNQTAVGNIAANDTSAGATRNLETAHQSLVGAVLASVQAAGQKAADDLVGASTADKQTAATQAQQVQLALLEQQFPGLRGQVQGYVGDLDSVPPEKRTQMLLDYLGAQAALDTLLAQLRALTSEPWYVNVAVVGNASLAGAQGGG